NPTHPQFISLNPFRSTIFYRRTLSYSISSSTHHRPVLFIPADYLISNKSISILQELAQEQLEKITAIQSRLSAVNATTTTSYSFFRLLWLLFRDNLMHTEDEDHALRNHQAFAPIA